MLVGNTIALVSAIRYDWIVNGIGPFELTEYLGLVLIWGALVMDYISAGLLITLLSAPPSPIVTPSHALAVSASREITRLVHTMPRQPRESRRPGQTQPPSKEKRWVARHPKLFGALVGFGTGCAVGASHVGGSQDNFFNTLDEFACPAVGAIGAGAGVLVGSLVK